MITGINIQTAGPDGLQGEQFTFEELESCHSSWKSDLGSFILAEDCSKNGLSALKSLGEIVESPVVIVSRCTSTMELAAQYAADGLLPAWGAVMAVRQESGRGQLRRHWVSEPGNLHVSFLLPRLAGVDPLWNRLLPLMVGWCLKKGLRTLGAKTVLKWPNDLAQLQNKELHKTCGLLIEDRAGRTIAGTGINLAMAPPRSELREGAAFPAGILDFSRNKLGPLRLWVELVKLMKKEYQALLDNSNPRKFTELLSQELLWIGEGITLHDGADMRHVNLLGLAKDGGLRILSDAGEEVIYSGSISKTFQADVSP